MYVITLFLILQNLCNILLRNIVCRRIIALPKLSLIYFTLARRPTSDILKISLLFFSLFAFYYWRFIYMKL